MSANTLSPGPDRGSKLTIGFGMVSIPIRYGPVAEPTSPIAGKLLCPTHETQPKQQYVCSLGETQEHVIPRTDMAKAFPHPDNPKQLVRVDESVLQEYAETRTGLASIERVVPADSIDETYYEKTYLVWPEIGHERQFDLLATSLRESKQAAIVVAVLTKKSRQIVFSWSEKFGCLLAHVCHFPSDLRIGNIEHVRQAMAQREQPSEQELALASQLLNSIESEFDPAEVQDTYTALVQDAIRMAARGETPMPSVQDPGEAEPAVNILDALKASIEDVKAKKKPAEKTIDEATARRARAKKTTATKKKVTT